MTENEKTWNVAALLFEGFATLDVHGPVMAFGAAVRPQEGEKPHRFFNVFCIGDKAGPVRSGQGASTEADHTFEASPSFDILLVPGGYGTRRLVEDEAFLGRLRKLSGRAQITASVCTGSALLARAGLLEGRRATTNKVSYEWATSQAPNAQWIRRARWVDDGDVVTSSGVSAGIDMTLALIERLVDTETAELSAKLMEHSRRRDPNDDPFA